MLRILQLVAKKIVMSTMQALRTISDTVLRVTYPRTQLASFLEKPLFLLIGLETERVKGVLE